MDKTDQSETKAVKNDQQTLGNLCRSAVLNQQAQQLIDDLNAKRKQDTQLLSDFKTAMESQVQKTCSTVEQYMFSMYEKGSSDIQSNLDEFYARMNRIAQLEVEMQEFKTALSLLYQDMQT